MKNFKIIGTNKKMSGSVEVGIFPEDELDKIQKNEDWFKSFEELIIVPVEDIKEVPSRIRVVGDGSMNVKATEALFTVMCPVRKESNDTTVFLGNQICSGKGLKKFWNYLINLSNKVNTIFLRGRNEDILIHVIEGYAVEPDSDFYSFIDSIESELKCNIKDIPKIYPEYWNYLNNTKPWYETNSYIFTPGSIYLESDWKTTPDEYRYKCTDKFLTEKNRTGKKIVFGDYPAQLIHSVYGKNDNFNHWYNAQEDKICLNGQPSEEKGKLLGLFIMDDMSHPVSIRTTRREIPDYLKIEEEMAKEERRRIRKMNKVLDNGSAGQQMLWFDEFEYSEKEKKHLTFA